MRDLRKKALLESQKTVSRKARSKPESSLRSSVNPSPNVSPKGSRAGSRANSRPNSRPGSRYASEDEDASDEEFDAMTMSSGSALSEDGFGDDGGKLWTERLQERIGELQDRKRGIHGRADTLAGYLHIIRHHYAESRISRFMSEIVPALLRITKDAVGEDERLLALKGLMLTLLTCPSTGFSGAMSSTLKVVCEGSEGEIVKTQAIYTLMVAAVYGGVEEEEVLEFLSEIVQSDGASVGADDSGLVVTAALRAWGFVASFLDDLAERSDQVIEAFIDQLDSTDPDVQSAAGTNIAYLFEAARDRQDETGEDGEMQRELYRAVTRMNEIVKDSSKSVSRRGKKQLRGDFASIITSLERSVGPGYSTALRTSNPHVGGFNGLSIQDNPQEFGYRQTLRIHNQSLLIDTWMLHVRVEVLKILLGGGLPVHYVENPTIRELLESAEVNHVLTGMERKSKA